jgi:hypothetical protein
VAADRPEVIGYLVRTTALAPETAERVLDDVIGLLGETVEEFVQRRHAELQREGRRNDEIFSSLAAECGAWRFRAAPLSSRQLRRIVYG